MNICDIMTDRVISIDENESVAAAAKLLKRSNVGALPVKDGRGRLKGIVTDRDIVLRCVAFEEEPSEVRVKDVMSRSLVTVTPFDEAETAARRMGECQIRRLPVTENGRLVGVVTLCDLIRSEKLSIEASEALADISSGFRRK